MLCGLTADKSRARLNATLGNAADDLCDLFGDILAASDVIKEEEGARAAADDVVYAHSNGIDSDGIMLVHKDRELDLGTAAVGARNEHGLFHTCDGETEAAAEAADVVEATLVFGACDMFFHKLDSAVAGCDINARRCVAVGFRIRMKHNNKVSFLMQNSKCKMQNEFES